MKWHTAMLASALAAAALIGGSVPSLARPPASRFWSTPTIQGYGRIHFLRGAAYQPNPARTYKIVFALTSGVSRPSEVNPALDHVARTVNLYVAAGVPLNHLKFVAVAYGAATRIALDNTHYRARFGTANPNLDLIRKLRRAGVDVAVCGQAVAEHHFEYSWVDPSVTIALSSLTTVTILEQQGYALMQI